MSQEAKGSNPQTPENQLSPEQLQPHFQEVLAKIEADIPQIADGIVNAYNGHPSARSTEINVEVTKPGASERLMARARTLPHRGKSIQEFTRDGMAYVAKTALREELKALIPTQEERDSRGSKDLSYVEGQTKSMFSEIFVDRGMGALRYKGPLDDSSGDQANIILSVIDGRNLSTGEIDADEAEPLTDERADDIVQLMPAILNYSMYKHGQWRYAKAFKNAVILLERIAIDYPEKTKDIDLEFAMTSILSVTAAAELDLRNSTSTYARDEAGLKDKVYPEILGGLVRVRAQQKLTASQDTQS